MRRWLLFLTVILATGVLASPRAQNQPQMFSTGTPSELALAASIGLERLRATAFERGIVDELVVSSATVDGLSMAHTRVQQRVGGVPVWGGEAIAHFRPDGSLFAETDNLLPNVLVDITPRITRAEAIAAAIADYGCADCLTGPASADLWIVRHNERDHLAYRVSLQRIDPRDRTSLPVYFIDAQGSFVVLMYDNVQTGTGSSLYSGNVAIGTQSYGSFYAMENLAARLGTFTEGGPYALPSPYNLFGFTFDDLTDFDDVWTDSEDRAGVDAQYGAERYLAYLSAVHGRNGLDGSGGPFAVTPIGGGAPLLSQFVHFGSNYNNAAFLSLVNGSGLTTGGLMVYGDGDGSIFSPLVELDVVAHEMTHGVTAYTARLVYHGESGALNESWSDVFGAMTERYVRGESTSTWRIGEQVFTPAIAGDALRYMDQPHLKSNSGYTADDDPDHYSERCTAATTCPDTPQGDNGGVHINSGIPNKAFYLLAKGGSHHLGGSMTGIGADAAARIWFVALSSYMTSTTTFLQARTATLNAAAALYGAGSTQQAAVASAWCLVGVGVCSVPTADSITPGAGSGSTQTFTLQYSDSLGATNLATTWVWFSATMTSSANSCLIHYARATNTINLLNDAGTTWISASLGSATTLQNAQCAIAVGSSAASPAGNTLTLTLAMTFKTAFGGAKNAYMYTVNLMGANSGWHDRGDWTVPTVVATITADSATPSAGTGAAQAFALQYSDSAGATDLATTWAWFSATLASSAANSCLTYYDRPGNRVFLLNDAASAWSSGIIGSATTLQNGQCSIALAGSNASPSGSTLTVTLAMTFSAVFGGAKNIYLYATNGSFNSGWQDRGDWTVPAEAAAVTADSATPSSGSGSSQNFALAYSSTVGTANLTTTWVWFNAALASAANSCLAYYDRSANTVFLLNDAGTAWGSGVIGGGTLQNSQCAIALGSSSALPSGNTLTLTLAMTFTPAFNGAKNIYMYATNGTVNSGWQDRGDWTVPAMGEAVTANSATPSTGSGSTQSFALAYGSTLGATNLSSTWVWFSDTLASTAANSCLIYYDRPSNLVFLLNDTATAWTSGVLGSATTLQNAQCTIGLAASSTSASGNTLTVTLAMTFTPAYSGSKNIYMYATNGVTNSGWHDRGDWEVP